MKAIKSLLSFSCVLAIPFSSVLSQQDTLKTTDITIIIPGKRQKIDSYIYLTGGYQVPAWIRVPMLPENFSGTKKEGNMEVKVPGWTTGIGIMKKIKKNFELGILMDFYRSTIPVAYSGQRSSSSWVYDMNQDSSYYTQVFSGNINRLSDVFSFRTTFRFKIPAENFCFWGGICAGNFSGSITYSEKNVNDPLRSFRQNEFGLTFQTGIDYISKNKKGKDLMNYTLFLDCSGPRIEENFISLFNTGWKYNNSKGNYMINPFRIGLAIGLHLN